jgi:hypothetical protein
MTEPCDECARLRCEVLRLRNTLRRLTSPLSVILGFRGFRIVRKEPAGDLLIPPKEHVDDFYKRLKKYSFRLFLRDVIKRQPHFTIQQVTRFATKDVTAQYVQYLVSIGLLMCEGEGYVLPAGPFRSFGDTLEWFVAEVFRREFLAEATWGVRIKKRSVGGDYDLLARIEGAIIYMEIKSSPPKQIYQNEIGTFLDRCLDLNPEVAIFFMDTELRMNDKIVPMFEQELLKRYEKPSAVRRMER